MVISGKLDSVGPDETYKFKGNGTWEKHGKFFCVRVKLLEGW